EVCKTAALMRWASLPSLIYQGLYYYRCQPISDYATALLPFPASGRKRFVDLRRGAGLHTIHDVRVKVHGDGDGAMAKSLLHDLRVLFGFEQVRGMGVAETLERHARQPRDPGDQAGGLMGQGFRHHTVAILPRADQGFA